MRYTLGTQRPTSHPAAARSTPPPSAPSKTFTIDVPIAPHSGIDNDPAAAFESLQETHERAIENLVPEGNGPCLDGGFGLGTQQPSSGTGSQAFSTPPDAAPTTLAFANTQPHFNLEFATSLLVSFKEGMLPYFPAVTLLPDADVSSLAKERPFVLLAMLAAASSGRSLQGHNLYDDEFRRVLGLKVVSNGERSVELLLGLLLYCAWYAPVSATHNAGNITPW